MIKRILSQREKGNCEGKPGLWPVSNASLKNNCSSIKNVKSETIRKETWITAPKQFITWEIIWENLPSHERSLEKLAVEVNYLLLGSIQSNNCSFWKLFSITSAQLYIITSHIVDCLWKHLSKHSLENHMFSLFLKSHFKGS